MANKIGRFEILSEIVHSEFSAVYKAADPDSGQTIALKTIQLQMLGDQAPMLVDQIVQEAESTKPLNSHNIALLYGLEEIEGQFCAAMEYVQGNSIGTSWPAMKDFPSGTCRTLRARPVRGWTTRTRTGLCTTAWSRQTSW